MERLSSKLKWQDGEDLGDFLAEQGFTVALSCNFNYIDYHKSTFDECPHVLTVMFLFVGDRKELQELQKLYKQSNEHAAQQAELIQQLQTLNVDTQKVLRSQENAHTTETISYQKVCFTLTNFCLLKC